MFLICVICVICGLYLSCNRVLKCTFRVDIYDPRFGNGDALQQAIGIASVDDDVPAIAAVEPGEESRRRS